MVLVWWVRVVGLSLLLCSVCRCWSILVRVWWICLVWCGLLLVLNVRWFCLVCWVCFIRLVILVSCLLRVVWCVRVWLLLIIISRSSVRRILKLIISLWLMFSLVSWRIY